VELACAGVLWADEGEAAGAALLCEGTALPCEATPVLCAEWFFGDPAEVCKAKLESTKTDTTMTMSLAGFNSVAPGILHLGLSAKTCPAVETKKLTLYGGI